MAWNSHVRVEIERLEQLPEEARWAVDRAAKELAFEVLRRALVYLERQVYTRPNVVVTADRLDEVPEPTGALWNSGYVRTYDGKLPVGARSQEEAESSARARNPQIEFGQAPPGPARPGQAQVLFAVHYALYVEMGTILGLPARPFLRPAAQEVQQFAERFVRQRLQEAIE
jgi:hypothetical protein